MTDKKQPFTAKEKKVLTNVVRALLLIEMLAQIVFLGGLLIALPWTIIIAIDPPYDGRPVARVLVIVVFAKLVEMVIEKSRESVTKDLDYGA